MRLSDIKSKTYRGQPLEEGGTSISTSTTPVLRDLFMSQDISDQTRVLDYGAGKSGRNARWLRARGVKVYAYDPYNGVDCDGWEGVSNKLPDEKFDVAFSSYVLNVVRDQDEDEIVQNMERYAPKCFHITRNQDVFDSIKKALERKDPTVTQFFEQEYGGGDLSDANVQNFCQFGAKTSKGFQRIPQLEHKGYNLIKSGKNYKLYSN